MVSCLSFFDRLVLDPDYRDHIRRYLACFHKDVDSGTARLLARAEARAAELGILESQELKKSFLDILEAEEESHR